MLCYIHNVGGLMMYKIENYLPIVPPEETWRFIYEELKNFNFRDGAVRHPDTQLDQPYEVWEAQREILLNRLLSSARTNDQKSRANDCLGLILRWKSGKFDHHVDYLEINRYRHQVLLNGEASNKNAFENWINKFSREGYSIDRIAKFGNLFNDHGGMRLEPTTVFFKKKA